MCKFIKNRKSKIFTKPILSSIYIEETKDIRGKINFKFKIYFCEKGLLTPSTINFSTLSTCKKHLRPLVKWYNCRQSPPVGRIRYY